MARQSSLVRNGSNSPHDAQSFISISAMPNTIATARLTRSETFGPTSGRGGSGLLIAGLDGIAFPGLYNLTSEALKSSSSSSSGETALDTAVALMERLSTLRSRSGSK
jgi:hypothetical protein